jgi:glycosyltransferase involved in cell wall biosynthesis
MAAARLWGGFDVVHAHTTYPNGYAAARTRRFSAAPLIITPHGEDINVIPELGFGARLDPQKNRKIEFALRHARTVTAISETIVASLQDAGVPPGRIVRIPNGVDLERFRSKPALRCDSLSGFSGGQLPHRLHRQPSSQKGSRGAGGKRSNCE